MATLICEATERENVVSVVCPCDATDVTARFCQPQPQPQGTPCRRRTVQKTYIIKPGTVYGVAGYESGLVKSGWSAPRPCKSATVQCAAGNPVCPCQDPNAQRVSQRRPSTIPPLLTAHTGAQSRQLPPDEIVE